MDALSELQDAETANEQQVSAVVDEVHTLTDQLAQTPPDNTPVIQDLTKRIKATTSALAALIPTKADTAGTAGNGTDTVPADTSKTNG